MIDPKKRGILWIHECCGASVRKNHLGPQNWTCLNTFNCVGCLEVMIEKSHGDLNNTALLTCCSARQVGTGSSECCLFHETQNTGGTNIFALHTPKLRKKAMKIHEVSWPRCFWRKNWTSVTLRKTNIVPENRPSQKDTHLPTINFQVLC